MQSIWWAQLTGPHGANICGVQTLLPEGGCQQSDSLSPGFMTRSSSPERPVGRLWVLIRLYTQVCHLEDPDL